MYFKSLRARILLGIIVYFLSVTCIFSEKTDYMGLKKDQVETQIIKIFDAVIIYPYPSWFSSGLVGDVYTDEKRAIFVSEQIPTGQSFDNWREIYALYGLHTKSTEMNLDTFLLLSIGSFEIACQKNNVKVEQILNTDSDKIVVIYCGQYLKDPKQGEIGLFRLVKFQNTYIKVYQEWRIKAFDVTNMTSKSWKELGVPVEKLLEAYKGLKSITFAKAIK